MKLKIALIGIGYWGKNYLRVICEMSDLFEFVGVIDSNQELIDKNKQLYPQLYFSNQFNNIIEKADCVIVATPANTHFHIVKSCLEFNKHVLVEKPLTLLSDESKKLMELAESKNLKLMVGYTVLFTEGFKFIKSYLKNHPSNIYYLNAKRTNLGIVRTDCNVIYDLTSHDIAVILNLLNDSPEWVNASDGRYISENIDVAHISLGFKEGIIANLHTSWLDCNKQRELVIITDLYRIDFKDTNLQEPIKIYNKSIKNIENKIMKIDKDMSIPQIHWNEPLKNQCKHFHESIINNQKPITNALFAYNVNIILDAIMKSINESRKIFL